MFDSGGSQDIFAFARSQVSNQSVSGAFRLAVAEWVEYYERFIGWNFWGAVLKEHGLVRVVGVDCRSNKNETGKNW
jgi:hypothetical protein